MLDWTRTDLAFKVEDESKALQYDAIAFAAFELYLLKRLGASNIYSEEIKNEAKKTRR
jgi:mannonate dehydratase